jgi:hypothetical protein
MADHYDYDLDHAREYVAQEERKAAARDILGFFHLNGGWQPGGFTTSLIDTHQRADSLNRIRLMLGFPVLGKALSVFHLEGEDALKEWAGLK